MDKCKITILKKTLNRDFVEKYAVSEVVPCEYFQEGQEIIVDSPFELPEGFCSWAWSDIRHDVFSVMLGGKRPYANPPEAAIACCTDGYRPVFFKIETFK